LAGTAAVAAASTALSGIGDTESRAFVKLSGNDTATNRPTEIAFFIRLARASFYLDRAAPRLFSH
jgi:hypothetical protein